MSLQESPQFELYNENVLIPKLVLDPVRSVIASDGQYVIERRTQQFFIKNIMSYSFIARVISKNHNVIVTQQPNVIHPTQFQAFTLEYQPTELTDLDGVVEFEIEPL